MIRCRAKLKPNFILSPIISPLFSTHYAATSTSSAPALPLAPESKHHHSLIPLFISPPFHFLFPLPSSNTYASTQISFFTFLYSTSFLYLNSLCKSSSSSLFQSCVHLSFFIFRSKLQHLDFELLTIRDQSFSPVPLDFSTIHLFSTSF